MLVVFLNEFSNFECNNFHQLLIAEPSTLRLEENREACGLLQKAQGLAAAFHTASSG